MQQLKVMLCYASLSRTKKIVEKIEQRRNVNSQHDCLVRTMKKWREKDGSHLPLFHN